MSDIDRRTFFSSWGPWRLGGQKQNRRLKMSDKKAQKEPPPEIDRLAKIVIGCAIEVHRHLGPGYLEEVYEEALCEELRLQDILFKRQHPISVAYKGKPVGQGRLDILVGDKLIVELKAVSAIAPVHSAQVMSYLKATNLPLGLLINFNMALLKEGVIRIINSAALED
jgi:GxxExxY protein